MPTTICERSCTQWSTNPYLVRAACKVFLIAFTIAYDEDIFKEPDASGINQRMQMLHMLRFYSRLSRIPDCCNKYLKTLFCMINVYNAFIGRWDFWSHVCGKIDFQPLKVRGFSRHCCNVHWVIQNSCSKLKHPVSGTVRLHCAETWLIEDTGSLWHVWVKQKFCLIQFWFRVHHRVTAGSRSFIWLSFHLFHSRTFRIGKSGKVSGTVMLPNYSVWGTAETSLLVAPS